MALNKPYPPRGCLGLRQLKTLPIRQALVEPKDPGWNIDTMKFLLQSDFSVAFGDCDLHQQQLWKQHGSVNDFYKGNCEKWLQRGRRGKTKVTKLLGLQRPASNGAGHGQLELSVGGPRTMLNAHCSSPSLTPIFNTYLYQHIYIYTYIIYVYICIYIYMYMYKIPQTCLKIITQACIQMALEP